MAKHAKKSDHLQLVDLPKTRTVEVPLPLLGAFVNIENSFFDLCIHAGRQVLDAMMEQDREELCGPRWKRDPDRSAGRTGTTKSEVTLGGRRVQISRPRVRSKEGGEMELPSFSFAASRDPLDRHTLNAVACGVSARKYARSLEPLPGDVEERSTSKSSVSRRYVAMTTKQMMAWLTTPLGDRHFPIVMIDGIILGDHTVLIALGIDSEGKKQVLGLREGDTENSRVAKDLAEYLREHEIGHTRGRPYHPMTQGKIERYHRSMKNVVRLENYYSPWELERAIARFVEYYNHERLHEAIGNVTPDDMYRGRQRAIVSRREKIKRLTLERRKKQNLRNAA
jgi:hypothetical protein